MVPSSESPFLFQAWSASGLGLYYGGAGGGKLGRRLSGAHAAPVTNNKFLAAARKFEVLAGEDGRPKAKSSFQAGNFANALKVQAENRRRERKKEVALEELRLQRENAEIEAAGGGFLGPLIRFGSSRRIHPDVGQAAGKSNEGTVERPSPKGAVDLIGDVEGDGPDHVNDSPAILASVSRRPSEEGEGEGEGDGSDGGGHRVSFPHHHSFDQGVAQSQYDMDKDFGSGYRRFDPFKTCKACFGGYDIQGKDDIVPYFNMCGCDRNHNIRYALMRLTAWKWFDRFFLFLTVLDNILMVLNSTYEWRLNAEMGILFAALYLIEVICKVAAWGLFGGKLSFWNANVFNRFDLLVVLASWLEVAAFFFGFEFSLRPLKLMRVLKPLGQFEFFHGLEEVMHTLEVGAIAMGTVLYLMLFFYVLFGVVGMELFAGSYARSCVWADTGETVIPLQYCKRFDEKFLIKHGTDNGAGAGLNSNCGALQLCMDIGAPNFGFSNFDNMASSFITVFQAFTTDSQASLMWAGIESEPDWTVLVIFFYLAVAFCIDQALMNVFLAVLTTVFTCMSPKPKPPDPKPQTQKCYPEPCPPPQPPCLPCPKPPRVIGTRFQAWANPGHQTFVAPEISTHLLCEFKPI